MTVSFRGPPAGRPPPPEATRSHRGQRAARSPVVAVIAADEESARRYLASQGLTAEEGIVVTDVVAMAALTTLQLRRADRVVWLEGWHSGSDGEEFAAMLEGLAQAGCFGTARHAFDVVL